VNFKPDEGWQFPQGGASRHKDPVSELKRELREEIGTDAITVVRQSSKTYRYDFPPEACKAHPGFRGQEQWWFLVDLDDDATIHFENKPPEFDRFTWIEPAAVLSMIVGFKRPVYESAMKDLGLLPQ
jgi:putative (di)nucleoside polyphosphate hydrolase